MISSNTFDGIGAALAICAAGILVFGIILGVCLCTLL